MLGILCQSGIDAAIMAHSLGDQGPPSVKPSRPFWQPWSDNDEQSKLQGSQNRSASDFPPKAKKEKRKADWRTDNSSGSRKHPHLAADHSNLNKVGPRATEESPLDMSTTSRLPHYFGVTPPPPLQRVGDHLPMYKRPSVITSCTSRSPPPPYRTSSCSPNPGLELRRDESKRIHVNSCDTSDPVIDEHFRRSLGERYAHLFASNETGRRSATPTDHPPRSVSVTGLSVDDHFAKALGDTWIKLQNRGKDGTESPKPLTPQSNTAGSQTGSNPGSPMPQRHGLVLT